MIQVSEVENRVSTDQSNVLIVEDNTGLLIAISALLKEEGFDVVSCTKPSEALPLIANDQFEVIIMDLDLPEMGGIQVFEKIQKMNVRAKVIIHTGKASLDSAKQAVSLGAYAYLEKLKNKIEDLVQEVHRASREHLIDKNLELENAVDERMIALQESEARYRDLFIRCHDPILMVSARGDILKVNTAAISLLEYTEEELLNMGIKDIFAIDFEAQRYIKLLYLSEFTKNVEIKYRKSNGERGICLISSSARRSVGHAEFEYQIILRDITERKNLEQMVLNISEHEKERFGQELHDDLGQILTGLSYHFPVIRKMIELGEKIPEEDLNKIEDLIKVSIDKAKRLSQGMYPAELKNSGLVAAVEELGVNTVKLFERSVEVECMEDIPTLDFSTNIHIFRIIQEAVTNAVKHTDASRIVVEVGYDESHDEIFAAVRDNGGGFDYENPIKKDSLGLKIMKHRANVIHGELSIQPTYDGSGTEVMVKLSASENSPNEDYLD